MRPLFHPSLVNGRYGDPTVYVETLFETHSVLFDLGEIASLSPRRIQRIDQIFVSHAHIDHFVGFDHLLRSLVGRKKTVHLYGPVGLPSAYITNFRPIDGIWSKATAAILFSL
jgi:ribonuclease Z